MYIKHLTDHDQAILRASNRADATLLITGKTGTGKSFLAQQVHRLQSKRRTSKWGKVNLATLSENIIESELFGHERGSFTGADMKRCGRLESCNGGVVFLDEVGELPIRLQSKLLDFIQHRTIVPVGSNREIPLDVRIIVATNKDLEIEVKEGRFREDLFHRLNIFHVHMPELSAVRTSVLEFSNLFLESRKNKLNRPLLHFSNEVKDVFLNYEWPGNLRELENTIEFAIAMEHGDEIKIKSLPQKLKKMKSAHLNGSIGLVNEDNTKRALTSSSHDALNISMSLDFYSCKSEFEKKYLERALTLCGGQINYTSKKLGLNKVSLAKKIKKHEIDWRQIKHRSFNVVKTQVNSAAN